MNKPHLRCPRETEKLKIKDLHNFSFLQRHRILILVVFLATRNRYDSLPDGHLKQGSSLKRSRKTGCFRQLQFSFTSFKRTLPWVLTSTNHRLRKTIDENQPTAEVFITFSLNPWWKFLKLEKVSA